MARTQILGHKWRPKTREPELSPVWWRRLTTVSTFTWRLSTRYCPSLSSELAEMIRKYYVHWETSVNVKQLIEKASPAFRPLHILLEKRVFFSKELPPKKAILLEIMLQKYYYARIMLL